MGDHSRADFSVHYLVLIISLSLVIVLILFKARIYRTSQDVTLSVCGHTGLATDATRSSRNASSGLQRTVAPVALD